MAFHDLTPDKSAPPNCKQLFGLGSKFITTPTKTTGQLGLNKTIKIRLRVHFAGEDSDDDEDADHKSKLYVKSKWTPSDQITPSWVLTRINRFSKRLAELFKSRKAPSNLNTLQQELLELLPSDSTYLFPETDKGLGPCAVKFVQYIDDVLVHLCNEEVYEQLSEEEASLYADVVHADITEWLTKYRRTIGEHAYKFISGHINTNLDSPFGQFYILYKIHKGIGEDGKWPTRPVSSDVTSLPHALGKWVTEALIPIQVAQPSYFKDSFELKKILDTLWFPPNALPFTADAHSMYTNIKTEPALSSISNHIRHNVNMSETKKEALIEAMSIVFKNNLFKCLQLRHTQPSSMHYMRMKCSHGGHNRSHFTNAS
eukprot:scaffold33673_cov37-Cyclotella_meneghiniana.AAC.2